MFTLLMADFKSFLDDVKAEGVAVGPDLRIKCLLYADDLVLLARSKM